MNKRIMQLVTLAACVVVLVVNYLAGIGWINNTVTSAVSDRYLTQITPAGYAFAIWSLIYLGMAAFSIFQALPSKRDDKLVSSLRVPFLLTCLLNSSWLVAWHYDQIPLTIMIICGLLALLLLISLKASHISGGAEMLLVRMPFNLYFGWVTVATILNATILLVYLGYDSSSAYGPALGAALIVIATVLGVFVRFKLNAFAYPLAIAWAVTAIAVKQSGNTPIVVAAAVSVVVLLFVALWGAVKDEGS